jgi:hypothetical protein
MSSCCGCCPTWLLLLLLLLWRSWQPAHERKAQHLLLEPRPFHIQPQRSLQHLLQMAAAAAALVTLRCA